MHTATIHRLGHWRPEYPATSVCEEEGRTSDIKTANLQQVSLVAELQSYGLLAIFRPDEPGEGLRHSTIACIDASFAAIK